MIGICEGVGNFAPMTPLVLLRQPPILVLCADLIFFSCVVAQPVDWLGLARDYETD